MIGWPSFPFEPALRRFRSRGDDAVPSLETIRQRYEADTGRFGAVPPGCEFETGLLGPIRGEWTKTGRASSDRLILYFHGGGYVAGSPETHRALVARLALASEARLFAPAYRLAPEHVFPAAVRDGLDAYRQLLGRGTQADSVVLAGDGAGGGLALAVLLAIRNAALPMPAALIAMSPWADLSLSGWSFLRNGGSDLQLSWPGLFVDARHYLGGANPADAYASPVFASFKGFPPLMIHAGSLELLRDDAARIGDRAAEAGIPVSVEIYDGMPHLFQADPRHAGAAVSLQRLGQFVRSRAPAVTHAVPARSAAGRVSSRDAQRR